jgi:hypothetical protein
MAGSKLDGAGMAKMHTLEDALSIVQTLHGMVERMAIAVRSQQNTSMFGLQIRRAGTPLVGMLKGQFGIISDQVAQLLLIATRGGSDQVKLRALREGIAQVRTALDIATTKVKEQHSTEVALAPDENDG